MMRPLLYTELVDSQDIVGTQMAFGMKGNSLFKGRLWFRILYLWRLMPLISRNIQLRAISTPKEE